MEENEDQPEDVRLATPVEDEIKKAEEKAPVTGNTKSQKNRVKDNTKKKKEGDEDEDCCNTKKRMKEEKGSKWATIHIFEKECKIPKPNVVPRHCLSKKEHLDMLATPSRKCEPQCLKKPVTRKLKAIPPRIAELARPPMHRILRTIEDRGDTIAPELLDNLIKMVEAESSLSPEQAAQLFRDEKSRSRKRCKKKRGKIKCDSKKEKEKRRENGDYPLFDPEAVCCQYLMAEQFVKSILDWKCPIPKEEIKDIAEVILKRLSFILEYTPIDNGDRKSQQMRFLADVISCWISGVLLEVAEAHRKELEEECERVKQLEEEETEEEEESEDETQSTLSAKSDDESEEEEDRDKGKRQKDKGGKKDEDKKDKEDQDKKPDKESAAQSEEKEDVVEEGDVGGEVMPDGGKTDEEEAERRRAEEEGAERQRLEEADVEKNKAEEEEARRKIEEEENERKRAEDEDAERIRVEEAAKARVEEEESERRKVEEEAEKEARRLEDEDKQKETEEAEKIRMEDEARQKEIEEAEKINLEDEAKQKEIEEAEKITMEDEARQKEIEEAEIIRMEDEARQKEIGEAEKIRLEDEAKQREIEEAEKIRVEDEAEKMKEKPEEKGKEEEKIQEVKKSARIEESDKTKELIPTETGPLEPDLPFVTFNKIFKTIYNMIENEKENTGEDPAVNRLHRAVYEKCYNAVWTENPGLLTDNAKDMMDVVTGKIAIWLNKILTESEVLLLEKYPPEVESKEVRDWSNWMKSTTQRAADWTSWLQKRIEEAQKMQRGQVTRGQYEDWTRNLHKNAVLLRQFHLDTVHKAHHNTMMIKDREVVKSGMKKTHENPEEELKVVNLE